MNRARRVLFTGMWGIAFQLVTVMYQVLTVPLFLKFWGQTLYGDWLTVASMVSYLALANLGMQSYVINLLTQRFVRGEWGDLAREIPSASLMYILAISMAATVLGGIVLFAPLDGLFADEAIRWTAQAVTLMLGARVVMMLFSGLVQGYYKIQGRADLAKLIHFLEHLGVLVVVFTVLFTGGGPVHLASAELGTVFVLLMFMLADTRRRDRRVSLFFEGANFKLAMAFLGPSLIYFFNQLAAGLIFQGVVLVVSWRLGAKAVVTFSTTRVLSGLVRQVISFTCTTMYPELTRIEAGNPERMAFTYRLLLKVVCASAFFCIPLLFFAAPDLYLFWTRGRSTMDLDLLRMLLLDIWLVAPMTASVNVLFSTNKMAHIRNITMRNVINGVLALTVISMLLRPVGLWTAGAVMAVTNLVFLGVAVPRWTQREVGGAQGAYMRTVYLPYLVCTAMLMMCAWLCVSALAPGILRFVITGAATTTLGLVLSWFIFLDAEERGFAMNLFGRLKNKLRK